jgi:hypothetical protein
MTKQSSKFTTLGGGYLHGHMKPTIEINEDVEVLLPNGSEERVRNSMTTDEIGQLQDTAEGSNILLPWSEQNAPARKTSRVINDDDNILLPNLE